MTGQYQARDLPRLARLTVLETIAMYQNVRSDLRETSIGARIEGEMSTLWDAAQLFYVSASYPPPDLAGLNRSRAILADVNAAYQQVDSSLRATPRAFSGCCIPLARCLPPAPRDERGLRGDRCRRRHTGPHRRQPHAGPGVAP